jgi:hypothetical protein
VAVFVEPVKERLYAIGVDVATERGADYSAAYVIDLTNMELVAEWHARVGVDVVAQQMHYLGRYYNTAIIAVESGGYGEAVIVALRDGVTGRPPYPKLYRHVLSSRPDKPTSKPFGFPMNSKTRPLVVNGLEAAIREQAIPWLPRALIEECQTFVNRDTGPSPEGAGRVPGRPCHGRRDHPGAVPAPWPPSAPDEAGQCPGENVETPYPCEHMKDLDRRYPA